MLEIEKDMTGLLFPLDSDKENSPNFTGNIKVEGKTYDIAMWSNVSKTGNDYFAVKVSEPYVAKENGSSPAKKLTARPKPRR